MRIAYLVHASGGSSSGVFHKIVAQAEAWSARGHDVRLFVLTLDDAETWTTRSPGSYVRRYDGAWTRLRSLSVLVGAIRAFGADVLYLRYFPFYPPMLALRGDTVRVIEVNTDDTHEYRLSSRIRSRYNALTRDLVLSPADAFVFVTGELSERPAFRKFAAKHAVITNGIELAAYPELPARAEGPPTLAFVGHPGGLAWQGVDRLVDLARGRPDWRFEVVGPAPDRYDPPSNMRWHGTLERPELLEVLSRADVGVGSLALYRNALEEASTLKVREYLAVGLPVMYAHRDPDADVLGEAVLSLPNDADSIEADPDRIERFVTSARGRRISRSAIGHIDVAHKEQERLALFEDLLDG